MASAVLVVEKRAPRSALWLGQSPIEGEWVGARNHPFQTKPAMCRVDKAVQLIGYDSAWDELTDGGSARQPGVAKGLGKRNIPSPLGWQFGRIQNQSIWDLNLPAAELLNIVGSLDMDEGFRHRKRRALGRVYYGTSHCVPSTLAVEPAPAVKSVGRNGRIRCECNAVQSHERSHDVAVCDAV